MAKSRAQRKAERRAREAEEQKRSDGERSAESRAQHDTQVPVSGEVAEIEAVEAGIAAGASEAQLETPDAPKPSRSQRRAEAKAQKDSEKRKRDEQKRKKVQWPDRETLIQATAVTILFVAIAAAYLGVLDTVFNFLIKRIL